MSLVRSFRTGSGRCPAGAALCPLKEMSIQLAGFSDDRAEALEAVAGEPTLAGNRLAEQHGISVAGFDPATRSPASRPEAKK